MAFRISALDIDKFQHLFGQSSEALAAISVQRLSVDSKPGFPCRITLQDADVGETVLLLNFAHQAAKSPYRSSHAIFVRENATQTASVRNEIPETLSTRMLSVRSFDDAGYMVDAELAAGTDLGTVIARLFADNTADYLHVHNAARGCYAARVDRAQSERSVSYSFICESSPDPREVLLPSDLPNA